MKKIRALALMSALAMVGSFGAAQAADPIIIKFSHVVAPDTPKGNGDVYKRQQNICAYAR